MPTFKDPLAPAVPDRSCSQAGQDQFVVAMTRGDRNKSFLEIGAGHPMHGNNTFLLENQYGWHGTSVEIVCPLYEDFFASWYREIRKPHWPDDHFRYSELPTWLRDEIKKEYALEHYAAYHDTSVMAQRNDLTELWKELRPKAELLTQDAFDVDYSSLGDFYTYLQIDIEPPEKNWLILQTICQHIRFAVITFEHDFYSDTEGSRLALDQSRKFLCSQGYVMVVGRLLNFEDWWVHPEHVSAEIYQHYLQTGDQVHEPDLVLFQQ